MNLLLTREPADQFIYGVLEDENNGFHLQTLENPWLNNEPYISCIPSAIYECQRINSPRFGNTFEVIDVPERTHILFHWGNYEKDTLGCILLGLSRAPGMITSSRKAFGEFMKYTSHVDEFILEVI